MKTINYDLTFYSNWHCGSGLSSGADTDALVVKNTYGLPFVPGKTIKGLVREAAELLMDLKQIDKSGLDKTFGTEGGSVSTNEGTAFFSNAELPESEAGQIRNHNLQEYLFTNIASTAIDGNGITVKGSLRKAEVTVPCTLEGVICDVPDEMAEIICDALRMIKRLGQNRTRGLGRCDFKNITLN